jgi:hypothetical protein
MKPVEVERTLIESPKLAQGMFGLSANTKDQAHILNILRNRLYTNKILAVLREYTTNGIDAHVSIGLSDKPIRVQLPTGLDPHLLIRDYGPGLAEEDIFGIYTQYGASTKRDSNTQIGMLGIGAKSAFAYSDSFVVTSYHNGKKSVFVAALDETNVGKMSKQWEGPSEETGVEIRIPVKVQDVEQFKKEAYKLFRFYDPVPTVNYPIPPVEMPPLTTKFGYLQTTRKFEASHGVRHWIGKVGVVPYNINLNTGYPDAIAHFIHEFYGCLYFDIGDVDIAANREELEYTPKTQAAILDKLNKLLETTKQNIIGSIEATPPGINRLQLIDEYATAGYLSPIILKEGAEKYTALLGDATVYKYIERPCEPPNIPNPYDKIRSLPFSIITQRLNKKWVESGIISWRAKKKFLMLDINIKVTQRKRYTKLSDYYLVQPDSGVTVQHAEELLEARLVSLGLQGMGVLRASQVDLGYIQPPPRVYVRRPKSVSTGLLCWSQVTSEWLELPRLMLPSDVETFSDTDLERGIRVLRSVDPFLELPTFVKTKKAYKGPHVGVPFSEWLANTLSTGEDINWHAQQLIRENSSIKCDDDTYRIFVRSLGEEHQLFKLLRTDLVTHRSNLGAWLVYDGMSYRTTVLNRYPLFNINVLHQKTKDLVHYVQLIDKYGV